LIFAGFVANSSIEFAKSYLEWMSEEILSRFEGSRDNPFSFRYIKLVTAIEDIPEGPKCVIATSEDCGYGIS
jgi:cleavage and polyadenylation specificity factor subunit 2